VQVVGAIEAGRAHGRRGAWRQRQVLEVTAPGEALKPVCVCVCVYY
jgi:hypothetical protein